MNLGPQPTINPLSPSAVEVHLLNQEINLYNLELTVEPIKKIRSQIKFPDTNSLSKQISEDIRKANQILKDLK